MDYRIVNKEAFAVLADVKRFPYEDAKSLVPQFWQEHFASGKARSSWAPTASTSTRRWLRKTLNT